MDKKYKRVVVKVGTKVIASKDKGIDKEAVRAVVSQVSDLYDEGIKVILVTSGAIGAGTNLLGLKRRPANLFELQAAASIGQGHLMQVYSEYLKARGYLAGQILLTQEDFNDRTRYLNIKHTVSRLLEHNAVPVINENDTVATDEIRCGDNDRLSGLVADLCQADKLILLTDVDGLLDEGGHVISVVDKFDSEILKLAGASHCDLGTGGMITKLEAAKSAAGSGIECTIANGKAKDIILKVINGEAVGTTFRCGEKCFLARKRWIAFSSRPKGFIRIDAGAKTALLEKNKSLLASGITGVGGDFKSGEAVRIVDSSDRELARGLSNYSAEELSKIKGRVSADFKNILGYKGRDEVIHKDNLAIL